MAAGTAIAARDRGVPLAAQVLVYPMLDDRNVDDRPALTDVLSWSVDDNLTAWSALLGEVRARPKSASWRRLPASPTSENRRRPISRSAIWTFSVRSPRRTPSS